MKTWFALAICALVLLGLPASGQTVFKCTDEKGRPVFTQQPCADDAEVIDTSDALRTATGGSNLQGVSDYAAIGRINHDCKNRRAAIAGQFSQRRNSINQEIAVTRHNVRDAFYNRQEAARAGLEAKLGSLAVALEQVRSDESAALREHDNECRQKVEDERARQAERDRLAAEAAAADAAEDD